MASSREIRTKINSVKSTKKITKAMQMVASSKMRKTEERMAKTRPYADKILDVISHLATAQPEYRNAYMKAHSEVKRVGYIVMTTDRGLCGALNTNVLRTVLKEMRQWSGQNVEQDLCLFGTKADAFFRHFGGNIVAKGNHITDDISVQDVIGMTRVMLDSYREGKIDRLYIAYNKFINTMRQEVRVQKLLPIASLESEKKYSWDYIYEPDAEELLNHLMRRYLESQVYQGAVDNLACEQAARMMAMMNATSNAEDLIKELELDYNKVRQAIITREISEIVSGAAAIE